MNIIDRALKLLGMRALPRLDEAQEPGELEKRTNINIVVYTMSVWSIGLLVALALRIMSGTNVLDGYTLIVLFATFIFLLAYLYFGGKYEAVKISLILLTFLFAPIRAYLTGGIYSPVIFLLGAHCILVLILGGKKMGYASIIWSQLIIWSMVFLHYQGMVPQTDFYEDTFNNLFTILMLGGVILMPTLFFLKEKEILSNKLRVSEKNAVTAKLIGKLSGKNMATIRQALNNLKLDRSDGNLAKLEESLRGAERSVHEVSETVDVLTRKRNAKNKVNVPRKRTIFRFLFSNTLKPNASAKEINKQTRLRTLLFFNVYALSIMILTLCIRLGTGGERYFKTMANFSNLLVVVGGLTGFFFLMVWIWRKQDVKKFGRVFLTFVGAYISIRVIQNGGTRAPVTFALFALPILVSSIMGTKAGTLTAVYAFSFVFAVGLLEIAGVNLPEDIVFSPAYQGTLVAFGVLHFVIPLIFITQEKQILTNELKRFDSAKTSSITMRRLNHEIGNLLGIALGYIELYKVERTDSHLEVVIEKIDEMVELVEVLSKKAAVGELVGIIEKHQDEIKISSQLQ